MSPIKFLKKKRRKVKMFLMTVTFLDFKKVYTQTIKENEIDSARVRVNQWGVQFITEGGAKLVWVPPHRVKGVTFEHTEGGENGKKDWS